MVTPKNTASRVERVHIGAMGWSYAFWVGAFYPKGTKSKAFLAEYSKHFNTVELNSTFYRIPSTSVVEAWRDQTPQGFLFAVKFPQLITHVKMLQDCEEDTERFLLRLSSLKNKLGPFLIQFPVSFSSKHLSLLKDFLPALPRSYRYAVEVRNKGMMGERLYSILRENGMALVMVAQPSIPEREDVTADFVYLRWEGDRREVNGSLGRIEVDRTKNIIESARRMSNFLDQEVEVFGYFSKYYSGYPPDDARQLLNLLV